MASAQVINFDSLLAPIPGEVPSGQALRYAPVYDGIKEARREDENLAQGDWKTEAKVADWDKVIAASTEALATKSKDLQLAAWLTEALTKREGWPGLRDGLRLLRELQEKFWPTLYPEVEDGDSEFRAAPIIWLNE